jgi:hypothetical protein
MTVELSGEIDAINGGTDRNWQVAISLVTAWRETDGEHANLAVAQRLASLAEEGDPEGDPVVVQQAVLGLTALCNTFLELYAERVGSSAESVLHDAATLGWDDGYRST